MVFYVDSDYRCHVTNDGTMTAVEDSFFDGKCTTFIEGHRYIPAGHSWTRKDGRVFPGIMITQWTAYEPLLEAQQQYEKQLLADMAAALNVLGVDA